MENHAPDETTGQLTKRANDARQVIGHDETTGHLTNPAKDAGKVIGHNSELPAIPAKRYFTIGEVSELCGVKAHVLRYWEQEFTQLKPVKRRGNRRYYQHHEVLLIRRIRQLLYEEGFTISGARSRLDHLATQQEETPQPPRLPLAANPSELRREIRKILAILQA